VRTWQDAYTHVFPPAQLAGQSVKQRTEAWRGFMSGDRERRATFVAARAGEIIGFADVGPSRDPDTSETTAELYAMYVLASEWGRGAGPALMDASLEALRALGFREAILWVLDDNPRARRFYERAGWSLDGATKLDRHFGVEVPEVRYRTSLA
jgi:GNAT superfamily N-acetyltransferase